MASWHKQDCTTPDIAVDEATGLPSCMSCNSAPDLDEIIRQQSQKRSFPAPPPDEPLGQLNLWWPRLVPYFNQASTHPKSQLDFPPSTAPTPRPPFEPSRTYPTQLKPNEIRLACFQTAGASPSPGAPVHLTLETYSLSNCPPYETVSYCWAGEDGNDVRTRPVYIGPYWDIMLHTQNCWDLLQFVKPSRGMRLVWVDAVCINQGCDEERAAQVFQMGRIYTHCTQVLVYLGPEIAPLLPAGQYPRRARLQDLGAGKWSGVTDVPGVKELLQRRYFGRLWVVQELILSPRVVIRIRDVDFHSDGATSGSLWSAELGELAHWVQHTSRGAPLEFDLHQVMRLTFSATCADPRDRIFGVMGIMSEDSPHLEPDYSLSVQQAFIGIFAYLVAARGMGHLLTLSRGIFGPASVPSWVPDWTSWERWQSVFHHRPDPDTYREDIFRKVYGEAKEYAPTLDGEITFAFFRVPLRYRWASPLRRETSFSVNSITGSLRAGMVRLVALDHVPRLLRQLESVGLMLFEVPCGEHHVYLVSKHRIDTAAAPGHDALYLFALDDRHRTPGFFILRKITGCSDAVRVVATCEIAFFRLRTRPLVQAFRTLFYGNQTNTFNYGQPIPLSENRPWGHYPLDDVGEEMDDPLTVAGEKRAVIGDLYWTVSEVIEWVQSWLGSTLDPCEQLLFLPRFHARRRDFLAVYGVAVTDDSRTGVFNAYRQYATDVLGAEYRKGGYILTTPSNAFYTFHEDHRDALQRSDFVWSRMEDNPATVQVKFSELYMFETIDSFSKGCRHILSITARKTGEAVQELLSRTSTEADSLVKVPNGKIAERLIEEYGCDGSFEVVDIP